MRGSIYGRRRARRSLIHTAGLRAFSQLSTVISYVVFVRNMPEQDFGVLNLMYAVIPVVSTLASLGLESTLRRFQPEYLQTGNTQGSRWLVRFVSRARLGANTAFLLAVLMTWDLTAPVFKLEEYRPQFAVFALVILIYFQSRILQFSLASHMLHAYSVGSVAVMSIAKLIGYSVLAYVDRLSLDTAIAADLAAYGAANVFLAVAYRRHCAQAGVASEFRPSREERRRLVRYGLLNNFNDAGTLVLSSRSDNFFIAAFIDPLAVGVYSFYHRLNDMITHVLPVTLFENVVQPLFFAVPRERAPDRIPRYVSLLVDLNLVMQLPVLVYLAVYHAEVVKVVFGGKFLEGSYLLPIIAMFATLNVFDKPVTFAAQYRERAGIILSSKLLAVYNVAALLALLPILGLLGAVLASGSAHVLKTFYIWWFVRNEARWMSWKKVVLFGLPLWGTVAVICILVKRLIVSDAIVSLIIGALVIAPAAWLYVRTVGLSAYDREILGAVMSGRERVFLQRLGLLSQRAGESPERWGGQ